jgi:hypothetical protein
MTTRPKVKPKPVRWTRAAIVALGVRTDLRTAGSIFGLSATQSYVAAKAGRLPFPVLRIGSRYSVPVQPLLGLLGIDGGEGIRSPIAGQQPGPAAQHELHIAPGPGGPGAA